MTKPQTPDMHFVYKKAGDLVAKLYRIHFADIAEDIAKNDGILLESDWSYCKGIIYRDGAYKIFSGSCTSIQMNYTGEIANCKISTYYNRCISKPGKATIVPDKESVLTAEAFIKKEGYWIMRVNDPIENTVHNITFTAVVPKSRIHEFEDAVRTIVDESYQVSDLTDPISSDTV
jgi:hypothetical protein